MKSTTILLLMFIATLTITSSSEIVNSRQQKPIQGFRGFKNCLDACKCASNCTTAEGKYFLRNNQSSEVSTTDKVMCLIKCNHEIMKCLGLQLQPKPNAEMDRIDFIFQATSDDSFYISYASLVWGKYYKIYPNEISIDFVNSITFYQSTNASFGACGRQFSATGAEGSFVIFHSEAARGDYVSIINFNVPYDPFTPSDPGLQIENNPNSAYSCKTINYVKPLFNIACEPRESL